MYIQLTEGERRGCCSAVVFCSATIGDLSVYKNVWSAFKHNGYICLGVVDVGSVVESSSVRSIAEQYWELIKEELMNLKELMTVIFFGYSFGGRKAFEVSTICEREFKAEILVAIVDTGPAYCSDDILKSESEMMEWVLDVLGIDHSVTSWSKNLSLIGICFDFANTNEDETLVEFGRRVVNSCRAKENAASRYQPSSSKGCLLYFKASGSDHSGLTYWGSKFKETSLTELEGSHDDVLGQEGNPNIVFEVIHSFCHEIR